MERKPRKLVSLDIPTYLKLGEVAKREGESRAAIVRRIMKGVK
jgi:hypothetical protein